MTTEEKKQDKRKPNTVTDVLTAAVGAYGNNPDDEQIIGRMFARATGRTQIKSEQTK